MNSTFNNGVTGSPPSQANAQNDGISMKLRQLYQELEQEEVPSNLLMLLDKLDRAEKASVAAAGKKSDE